MDTTLLGPPVGIALPRSWIRRRDPAHGVVVAARPRVIPHSGLAPQITLRVIEPREHDLNTWRERALAELAGGLPGFELDDDDRYDVGLHTVAYHRFGHDHGGDHAIVEQWAWYLDSDEEALDAPAPYGITLTCAVARSDYADYCDLFDAVAGSVEPYRLIEPAA